jgi:hypothetical protein
MSINPMQSAHDAPRCKAKSKRTRKPCRAPAVRSYRVCRMHGARGGAPEGKRNGNFMQAGARRKPPMPRVTSTSLLVSCGAPIDDVRFCGHNRISALAAVSDFASAASRPENRGLSGCSQLNLIKGISKPDRPQRGQGFCGFIRSIAPRKSLFDRHPAQW